MLNAKEISGKASNKLHIYLLYNETYEFVFISAVFRRLELDLLLNACAHVYVIRKRHMQANDFS